MKSVIALSGLIAIVLSNTNHHNRCDGTYEVFKSQSDCAVCDDVCGYDHLACVLMCQEGCRCVSGYVRDQMVDGECIPKDECPTDEPMPTESTMDYGCEENEVFTKCGSMCPDYCGADPMRMCNRMCYIGCQCKDGYILDELDGVCIPEEQCPTDEPMSTEMDTTVTCGENEEFTDCGSMCPDYCGASPLRMCNFMCFIGCQCKDGYILDEMDGECIPEDECPTDAPIPNKSTEEPSTMDTTVAICDANEEFTTCGSTCPDYCGASPLRMCNKMCFIGCQCKDGYILDQEDGECIPEDECPTDEPMPSSTMDYGCGVNEEFTSCGTMCPDYCGADPMRMCNRMCFIGCQCKDGYILDEMDGECIPEDECPTDEPMSTESIIETTGTAMCGENEEFTDCGTMCPAVCGEETPSFCNFMCFIGCQCKEGYILDEKDGECIPEDECQTNEPSTTEMCGENEEFTSCGTMCPAVCGKKRPMICNMMCFIGCQCKSGYILDEEDGECIPEDECSTDVPSTTGVQCEENEEFTTCGTMCPDYCGASANRMCNRMCFIGCKCKDGYILDEMDGDCILEDDCPMNGTETTGGFVVTPSDANAFGLMMVFGVVAGVFGWM